MARVRGDRLVESLRINMKVRRDGSMVKSAYCSFRGPKFAFQYP